MSDINVKFQVEDLISRFQGENNLAILKRDILTFMKLNGRSLDLTKENKNKIEGILRRIDKFPEQEITIYQEIADLEYRFSNDKNLFTLKRDIANFRERYNGGIPNESLKKISILSERVELLLNNQETKKEQDRVKYDNVDPFNLVPKPIPKGTKAEILKEQYYMYLTSLGKFSPESYREFRANLVGIRKYIMSLTKEEQIELKGLFQSIFSLEEMSKLDKMSKQEVKQEIQKFIKEFKLEVRVNQENAKGEALNEKGREIVWRGETIAISRSQEPKLETFGGRLAKKLFG